MSSKIAHAIWDYQGNDLSSTQTAILVRMAWYASDAGRDIFPTIPTLSRQTKFAERTIRDTIKYLIESKFLVVEQQSMGRHATRYKINLDRLNLVNEFNERSSSATDIEPCAKCMVGKQPCAKCRVNPAAAATNPAPAAYINTNKDEYKNNNVVEPELVERIKHLARQTMIPDQDLKAVMIAYKADEVHKQLVALQAARGVLKPVAWLQSALKKGYQPERNLELVPASYETWSQELQTKRNAEVEKLMDKNDWRNKLMEKAKK